MIKEPEIRPPREKKMLYPKSVKGKVAKIQYDPYNFKTQLLSNKYFAIGDSFVNMFIHAQNSFHIKLKGKSIKGLAKADTQDRQHIQKWVKASRKDTELIFNFGQVDLNLIRYYKVAHKEDYPQQTFQEYVDWISTLNRKTYIIGVFVSPIKRQDIISVLGKYGTLQGVECEQQLLLNEYDQTQNTRKKWNDLISSACSKNGIKFINIFEHHKQIEPMFIDQNPKTIHLRYLPCILSLKIYLQDLVVDIDKALQIQNEYQVVKTQRHSENLRLLEQRIRLQSQQAKNKQENKQAGQSTNSLFQEAQSDKTQNETQNLPDEHKDEDDPGDNFISLLQIPTIKTVSVFFEQLVQPGDQNIMEKIVQNIVLKGMKWTNPAKYSNQFSMLLSLLKDIYSLKDDQAEDTSKAYSNFSKLFVSTLQRIFQSKLQSNLHDQNFGIQNLIQFIISLSISQDDLKFNLLSAKIVLIIIKQIVISLFKRIMSKDEARKNKILAQYNCLYKIQSVFRKKMDQAYQKHKSKKKLNQSETFVVLLENISSKRINQKEAQQKSVKFEKLISEQHPYAIFSKQIFSLVLNSFQIQILASHSDIRIKEAVQKSQQNQIASGCRLQKRTQKIEPKPCMKQSEKGQVRKWTKGNA